MASPGGTPSLTSYEEDQLLVMDQRKRKRMLSNRESAKRSRMRKQKHLDDLTAQVAHLRAENNHILTNMNVVTQLYMEIESENSVLRAQMSELNHRLQALNDIINSMSFNENCDAEFNLGDQDLDQMFGGNDAFLNPWGLNHINQPIMASSDAAFMY